MSDDRPWAYWSLGPQRVRLHVWKPEWVELSPFGMTLEDARQLRAGLDYAIKQAAQAEARTE